MAYKLRAVETDGLLFSNSRGKAFDTNAVALALGAKHVASFAVSAGAITDHLPFLKYILSDQAAHGGKIQKVLLLLDADFFGTRPWTNLNLDSFLPPEVSGESGLRFWLRYLFAVQFKGWRESITSTARRDLTATPNVRLASLDGPPTGLVAAGGQPAQAEEAPTPERLSRISKSHKPFLNEQLRDLDEFVQLCRRKDIQLTIALNPLTRVNSSTYEPGRLEDTIASINEITDLWDFTAPEWLAEDLAHWLDVSHFRPEIAQVMLDRMFANAGPSDFGRFRRKAESGSLER
ncbi:hypothetical protein [Bradyrhizobium sp. LHD-71]|uniref:hypothetical protein n=1 Tax=Bradyrhizobium sp. LHD-71 TaxID=3072141 RepID=UPI00281037D6|nr:hypothetical protein [Bradyrhizobium sp. LHD-71]MDQ8726502.1 hypothetical protein [Bradyrhizobium sp. LHD-71]